MKTQCKHDAEEEEEVKLIVGECYRVTSNNKKTGKIGVFIGLMEKGREWLDFGQTIQAYKTKNLI